MDSIKLYGIYFVLILSFFGIIKSTPLGEYVGYFKYTNYTMEDVENIKAINCKTDADCPEFSNGCAIYSYWNGQEDVEYHLCEMTYMCHTNSTCLFLQNASTYYIDVKRMEYGIAFVNNSTRNEKVIDDKEKLILHSCSRSMVRHNLCETDVCLDDSNCFSNNCMDQTCVISKDYPSFVCRVDWVDKIAKPEMQCKKANSEKCTSNEDCDQINVCDDRYHVCASPLVAENNGRRNLTDYLFFIGIFLIILCIIIAVILVSLFVFSCAYVALDELKSILFNIGDDYRQLENN